MQPGVIRILTKCICATCLGQSSPALVPTSGVIPAGSDACQCHPLLPAVIILTFLLVGITRVVKTPVEHVNGTDEVVAWSDVNVPRRRDLHWMSFGGLLVGILCNAGGSW